MNDAVKAKYEDPSVQIIDEYGNVHMAHMDIHYSHSVNGVARLHTDILKETELNNFYKLYPEKFNNKTNGITFRRWVIECNPELTELITEKIGEGWKTDARQLEQLIPYAEDATRLTPSPSMTCRSSACTSTRDSSSTSCGPSTVTCTSRTVTGREDRSRYFLAQRQLLPM